MKKIALTSLVAVFAASSAMAANVSNPLYRPMKGHFYSDTTLETTNHNTSEVAIAEKFGYGITDIWSIELGLNVRENNWFASTGFAALDDTLTPAFTASTSVRFVDEGAWKADVYGGFGMFGLVTPGTEEGFFGGNYFEKEASYYGWQAGVRGGYVAKDWTLGAHATFQYFNSEAFNWGDTEYVDYRHQVALGLDGQLYLNHNWNVVAGVEYTFSPIADIYSEFGGKWTGMLGINYDICGDRYVGAYVKKTVSHEGADKVDPVYVGDWHVQEGYTFGVKFGIDF